MYALVYAPDGIVGEDDHDNEGNNLVTFLWDKE